MQDGNYLSLVKENISLFFYKFSINPIPMQVEQLEPECSSWYQINMNR